MPDDLAYDALAAWIRRGGVGRGVESCIQLENGTVELVLRHELGHARSVSTRTIGKAIGCALANARVAGAL